jgi:insulysin
MSFTSASNIKKPLLDHREYRHITLPNKLEALLISDPQTDKSAAAVDCRVGSLFDPPQWQGLAHFCEHMLFLGTTKYPSEDEYQSYLAKNGGMSNAFTADNHTCYFFNVSPEKFEGALDRFGQFFVSPLFTQSATDREVNAVHSEHSKNVQEDVWRQYQLMRDVCFDPRHPSHHFSTGNKETLGNVPRDVLLNFHKAWYSANICRVAVLGKESLDELERMVTGIFADVPNKDVIVPIGNEFSDANFTKVIEDVADDKIDTSSLVFDKTGNVVPHINSSCLNKAIYIVPVKEQRTIQFSWFLPEQRTFWKEKPARYLSHILGHEGPGSLTQVLKAKGLATDLVGGLFYDSAGISLFKVDVHLTKNATGLLANDASSGALIEMTEIIASYIRLALLSVSETLWKEVEVVDNLGFTFRATQDPMTAVQTVANSLHYYPVEEVLAGPSRIYSYDETAIRDHLSSLNSSNLFFTLVGKEFSPLCDTTEKWYGTKYGVRPIDGAVIRAFEAIEKMSSSELEHVVERFGLAMPLSNPFLPSNLEVLKNLNTEKKVPGLILTRTNSAVFHKQDNKFKMPKANAAFAIYCPHVQSGIKAYVSSELLLQSLVEDHSQVAYQADIAGLKFKLKGTMEGVNLSLSGYSDKMPVMVESVVEKLKSYQPSESQFNLVKDRTVRQLESQLLQKAPYSQALDLVHQVILSPFYSIAEKLEQVKKTSVDDLGSTHVMFENAIVESLIEGNFDQPQASCLAESVIKGIVSLGKVDAVSPKRVGTVKVMDLDSDVRVVRRGVNPNETNGAVAVSVQTGWLAANVEESDQDDLESAALLSLTSQICGQKFFDDLRTKQQLGYIVHSSGSAQERRAGMLFLVQSEVKTSQVKDRIFEFIDSLDSVMESISEDDFRMYINAVIADLKEKPKNQTEEFQRHWAEIEKRRLDFDRKQRLIPVVENLRKAQLIKFVKDRVIAAPKVIAVVAGSNDPDVQTELSDEEIKGLRRSARWVESYSRVIGRSTPSRM